MQKPSELSLQKLRALAIDIAGTQPVRITIAGRSMLPILQPGDAAFLSPAKESAPEVGQIVTFIQGESLLTHRVVSVRSDHILTKGDHVQACDPPVPTQQVIGRVIARERGDQLRKIQSGQRARWIAALSRLEGGMHQRLAGSRWRESRIVRAAVHRPFRSLLSLACRLFGA